MSQLDKKAHKYLELIKKVQDKEGFIDSHGCDSLLFSALTGCVSGISVNIKAAFDGQKWHRRPLNSASCCDCWNPNSLENQIPFSYKLKTALKEVWSTKTIDSAKLKTILSYKGSTISRDMLIGLAWYAWTNKRLDISESVITYALKNWGVMGEGDPWRINIMPALFSTFCWISYRLGGPSRSWARWIGPDSGAKLDGYQAHLQVLHVLLRIELSGNSERLDKILIYHARREPNNPLFQIAVCRYWEAEQILLNEALWPSDRLPNSSDRKTQWVPERDEGSDWEPETGSEFHQHSGGDLLFCWWLLNKLG